MQININASEIGTAAEEALMTSSRDPNVWLPIVNANIAAGRRLYESRKWEPWFAYTFGWATFPAWWTWHQENGKAIGPWMKTGRYLQRALVGVANFHHLTAQDMTLAQAVKLADSLAAHFKVQGKVGPVKNEVYWTQVPPKPSVPPADGLGPRPVPNNGL